MFQTSDTARITDSMTAAMLGYSNATAAAYSEMMSFGLSLWGAALGGLGSTSDAPVSAPALRRPEPAFGHALEDWCGLPWLDKGRVDDWSRLMVEVTPMSALTGYLGLVPLRGHATSWPVAKTMIDAGVPRSIAWPTAEANAAVLAATEAAMVPMCRAFITAPSPVGYTVPALPLPAFMAAAWGMPH